MPTLRVGAEPASQQFQPGGVDRLSSCRWTFSPFRVYVAGRVRQAGDIGRMRSKMNGKFWWELSDEEHRALPGRLRSPGQPGPRSPPTRPSICAPATAAWRCCAASCASSWRSSPAAAIRAASPAAPAPMPCSGSPTAAISWRRPNRALREGPAAHAADAGGALRRGDPRSRARARAGGVPLGARRRRAGDDRHRPRLAPAGRPGGADAAPRLGLLHRGRRGEAARSRPRAACRGLAHRRSGAGRGHRPVRGDDGAAPCARHRALSSGSRRSAPGSAIRCRSRGIGCWCSAPGRWAARSSTGWAAVGLRGAGLEPPLAGTADDAARPERGRRLRPAPDRDDRGHPRRQRLRRHADAAATWSTSPAARTWSRPT